MDKSLRKIGLRTGTDKVTYHGYDRFYPLFLDHIRHSNIKVLEVGVHRKESIEMWVEYFADGYIFGIDINMEEEVGDRFKIFRGDQRDLQFLERVSRT
ncbi:MAG: hypothetical protein AAF740_10270, partial [Bacteroidota bacterium]